MIRPDDERLNLSTVAHLNDISSSALPDDTPGFSVEAPMRHSLVDGGVDDDVDIVARLVIDKPRGYRNLSTLPRMATKDLPTPTPKPVRLYDHRSG